MIKTVWAGLEKGRNEESVKKNRYVIEDRPIEGRSRPGEYELILNQLKIGQCIRIERADVEKMEAAIRHWIKKYRYPYKTKRTAKCKDGYARIWLLEK